MCGRYLLYDGQNKQMGALLKYVQAHFNDISKTISTSEVYPGQNIIIYKYVNNKFKLSYGYWGIKIRDNLVINARHETARDRATFKNMKICLIPSCGYYEWHQDTKEKMFIYPDHIPFYLCGLLDETNNKVVILTEESTGDLKTIHNRQPIILLKEDAKKACLSNDISLAHALSVKNRNYRVKD